ncbi:hypothetical protein CORC01_08812 [Colletotrichum orchidophilum]|uniref:Uncharacterized protein n=1 Tax=Colletotrichum orchidophilum TaxID=1209926 RepID=A0A1G4B3H0_9PEZI|nr:uncharacterized protein CORC01_08812 [Colletotrichum orchidophilum]OHE95960.1 hypothetical protein CORC01_08812 [Colletotrichum orchidophilum]
MSLSLSLFFAVVRRKRGGGWFSKARLSTARFVQAFKHSSVASLLFSCSGSAVKCHDSPGNQDAPQQAHAGLESVGRLREREKRGVGGRRRPRKQETKGVLSWIKCEEEEGK